MPTKTERLNLTRPSIEDDIQQTILALSDNFKAIDDNFDETISDIKTFLTTGRFYDSGKKFWNRIPSIRDHIGWANIRSGVYAPSWKKQTTYTIGDKVSPDKNNGHYYECIVGGTSALSEPSFPTTTDTTVSDLYGHTIWKPSYQYKLNEIVVATVGDKSFYYKCIIAGTSGTNEPSWTNISGSTVIDGGVQWYVYKTAIWRQKGISCEFVPFGSLDTTKTRKYAQTIGNGTDKKFLISHNLGTQDVVVTARETGGSLSFVNVQVKATDANNIVVEFSVAPTTNSHRIIVIG